MAIPKTKNNNHMSFGTNQVRNSVVGPKLSHVRNFSPMENVQKLLLGHL